MIILEITSLWFFELARKHIIPGNKKLIVVELVFYLLASNLNLDFLSCYILAAIQKYEINVFIKLMFFWYNVIVYQILNPTHKKLKHQLK